MTALASSHQIQALQAMRRKAGISDDDWRARLLREAGVTSTKLVPVGVAIRLIDELKGSSNGLRSSREADGARNLSGPYAGKLRALWLTGYNLGVVKVRTDVALLAFAERQTGISHTRFLIRAGDAKRVIEGLKAWIGREAGLSWPEGDDSRAIKQLVIERQWDILLDLGAVIVRHMKESDLSAYARVVTRGSSNLVTSLSSLSESELDQVQKALGAKLRKAKGAM